MNESVFEGEHGKDFHLLKWPSGTKVKYKSLIASLCFGNLKQEDLLSLHSYVILGYRLDDIYEIIWEYVSPRKGDLNSLVTNLIDMKDQMDLKECLLSRDNKETSKKLYSYDGLTEYFQEGDVIYKDEDEGGYKTRRKWANPIDNWKYYKSRETVLDLEYLSERFDLEYELYVSDFKELWDNGLIRISHKNCPQLQLSSQLKFNELISAPVMKAAVQGIWYLEEIRKSMLEGHSFLTGNIWYPNPR